MDFQYTPSKIAIKYCGGCNPRFDRKGLITKLLEALPELEATSTSDPEAEIGLVICGCSRGCAASAKVSGEKLVIWDAAEYPTLLEEISGMLNR